MRVLLVNNIPAPYFDPLFARLGNEDGWSLTVCYASTWNQQAGWVQAPLVEASHRIVILDRGGRSFTAGARLLGELIRTRPDFLIIYGYTLVPQCVAMLWSTITRTRYALIGDANIHTDKTTGLKGEVKWWWIRRAVRRAAAIIAIGTANRMFWEKYGAHRDQLFESPYAVDNDHFARAVESARSDVDRLRKGLTIPSGIIFLFVGRLVRRKNVDLIIRAVRAMTSREVALVIAGDGDERGRLAVLAEGDPRIAFAGAVPQSLLPTFYAMADCLVLPASDEPWGLVVNEAMASGLAVIAHKDCGAAIDLVSSNNGVVLETFDVDEMQRALEYVSEDRSKLERMKLLSLERVSRSSIDQAARGIIEAVSTAMSRGAGPGGAHTARSDGVVGEVK